MAIKTRTKHEASVEGGDAALEDYLDSKGVKWEFHPGLDTSQFDVDKSLKNQARFEAIDQGRVDNYAEAMKRGDKFPPVIAHGRMGKLINADGNHRLMSAIKAKKPLDTYVISGDGATITLISHERNAKHGWPTSEDERIAAALYLIDTGSTIPSAAAALSLSRSVLTRASARRGTDQRFKDNKIPALVIEKLSETAKWRLSQVSTDEGFVALTDLAYRANLNSDVVFELVTEVNKIRSSEKQVDWIEQRKRDFIGDIQASGGGVFTRAGRGPRQRVNMAVTNILNLPETVEELADAWKGADKEDSAKRMQDAARKLNALARQLRA